MPDYLELWSLSSPEIKEENKLSVEIWRPFTQMGLQNRFVKIEKAKGALLFDQEDKAYIDAISSWWVINHGHCAEPLVRALRQQAGKLDQVLFGNFATDTSEALVEELNSLLPSQLCKYFFSDNGSTAVEVALKIAVQYWLQSGRPEKNTIVSFQGNYHGDTAGAMSVSGPSVFTDPYRKMLFHVEHFTQPWLSTDDSSEFLKKFKSFIHSQKERLAALIIEPLIQGAGGMRVWSPSLVDSVVSEARAAGLLIIFDEVMTGFGRTGTLFAFEQLGFQPDILCLSKGLTGGMLPMALTIATNKVYEAFLGEKDRMLFHGHSFTGNCLSGSVALANLKMFQNYDYSLSWKNIYNWQKKWLNRLVEHPRVLDVRQMGTMACIELRAGDRGYTSTATAGLVEFSLERGVFLRPLGSVIYCLPPYCVTEMQIDTVWQCVYDFLNFRENENV